MLRIAALAAALLFVAIGASANYYDTHLLTKADVDLYLKVMTQASHEASAFRARHNKPCPKQQPIKPGHVPTPAETQAMVDAINCAAAPAAVAWVDDDIANRWHLNPHYAEVRDGIEGVIQPDPHGKDGVGEEMGISNCGDGAEPWACAPDNWTPAMKAKFDAMDKIAKQNRYFLKPWRAQIQRLQTQVRRIGEEQPNPFGGPGKQPAQYGYHPMPEPGVGPNGPVRQ